MVTKEDVLSYFRIQLYKANRYEVDMPNEKNTPADILYGCKKYFDGDVESAISKANSSMNDWIYGI